MDFSIPTSKLWIFPAVGGTAWFLTLFTLLIYWLAQGRPVYPLQTNPYIAFISDIGAFHLKPLFIVGGILSAIGYTGTIASAHYIYHHHIHSHPNALPSAHPAQPEDSKTPPSQPKRTTSAIAIVAAIVAGVACILMTFFDTYRWHESHSKLLLLTFLGIAVSGVCTSVVYSGCAVKPTRGMGVQKACIINIATAVAEIVVTVAFMACAWAGDLRVAGILEWIISFFGAFYMWSFIGILWISKEEVDAGERQPLLTNQD